MNNSDSVVHYNPDPETQVLVIGDIHIGCKTPQYNTQIALRKLTKAAQYTLLLHERMAVARPVRELVILDVGDNIHGERVGQQMSLDEYEMPVREQIHVCADALAELIATVKPAYAKVSFYGVPGTHGMLGKQGSEASNWELTLYDRLQLLADVPVVFPNDFYQIVPVNGKKVLMLHGDYIPCNFGIPYYGIDRRVTRWKESLGSFDFAVMGHFHSTWTGSPSGVDIFVNGSASYGSSFPLTRMGLREDNRWWTFCVHEGIGVTDVNRIHLNYKLEVA